MNLQLKLKSAGKYKIICANGELDIYSSPGLRDKIKELVEKGIKKIAIDMAMITYIDSIGLGSIVAGLKAVKEKKGKLAIIAPSEYVLKIFQMTSMDEVVDIYKSVKEMK